jgi:hypothetical protein
VTSEPTTFQFLSLFLFHNYQQRAKPVASSEQSYDYHGMNEGARGGSTLDDDQTYTHLLGVLRDCPIPLDGLSDEVGSLFGESTAATARWARAPRYWLLSLYALADAAMIAWVAGLAYCVIKINY